MNVILLYSDLEASCGLCDEDATAQGTKDAIRLTTMIMAKVMGLDEFSAKNIWVDGEEYDNVQQTYFDCGCEKPPLVQYVAGWTNPENNGEQDNICGETYVIVDDDIKMAAKSVACYLLSSGCGSIDSEKIEVAIDIARGLLPDKWRSDRCVGFYYNFQKIPNWPVHSHRVFFPTCDGYFRDTSLKLTGLDVVDPDALVDVDGEDKKNALCESCASQVYEFGIVCDPCCMECCPTTEEE